MIWYRKMETSGSFDHIAHLSNNVRLKDIVPYGTSVE